MKAASMKEGGFYDAHSSIQKDSNAVSIPLIQEVCKNLDIDSTTPIYIVDYGSSQGANSIPAARAAVDCFRERNFSQAICVIHDDLPSNDFNRLFLNLNGGHQDTYLSVANVLAFACGVSFYNQVVPSNTVHLGISAWALQWLSQLPPLSMPDHIYYGKARGESAQILSNQAAIDWERFLVLRAMELVPGGRLVLTIPRSLGDEDSEHRGPGGAQDLMNETLQDMVREGLIERSHYEDFVFPFYFRTLKELRQPLEGKLKNKFKLESAESQIFACPLHRQYQQTKDLFVYAHAYSGWLRAWSEPILINEIFQHSAECSEIANNFYDRIVQKVMSDPERYKFTIETIFLALTRTDHSGD